MNYMPSTPMPQRVKDFIKSLGEKQQPSLNWAYSLKSDYLDGVCLLPIQQQLASEALGEVWKDRACTPA